MSEEQLQETQATPEVSEKPIEEKLYNTSKEGPKGESDKEVETKSEETESEESGEKTEESGERDVPEHYDLKLSEESKLNDEHLSKLAEYAKENGLTQDQAEKLLARDEELVSSAREEFQQSLLDEHESKKQEWFEAVEKDTEFGGEHFNENAEMTKRYIDEFADEEFKTMLDETGYGNHPLLFKMMVRASKAMAEDKTIRAGSSNTELTHEQRLYPNMNQG
jgi:hypothetical protein